MGRIEYHNGSSFQELDSGDAKYYDGSEWKTIKKGYYMPSTGVTWTEFYTGSDPASYAFLPSSGGSSLSTTSARGGSWKTAGSGAGGAADYIMTSKFSTAPGVKPWFGLIHFNGTNTTGAGTLTQLMNERPVVKNVWYQAQRWGGTHGYPHGFGQVYLGRYNGYTSDSTPNPSNCDFSSYQKITYNGTQILSGTTITYGDGYLTRGEFLQDPTTNSGYGYNLGSGTFAQNLITHLKSGKAMCMSATRETGNVSRTANTLDPGFSGLNNTGNALNAGKEDLNYWAFNPGGAVYLGVNIGPMLVVTLDYA